MIPTSDALLNAPPARGKVTHALISVFDKSNLETLAKGLHEKGVVLLSSGGTAKHIANLGIPVTEVSAFTQADEVLGGRVKTLHPKIHAGILADRREESHLQDLEKRSYVPIDLVVCNLYPFEQAAATYTNEQQIIENIDIGGPTMVRAAAKNAIGGVSIIVDPQDYGCVMDSLGEQATIDYTLRRELAKKAFSIITQYDQAISSWYLGPDEDKPSPLPPRIGAFQKADVLRYGENPHQSAAIYQADNEKWGCAHGTLHQGKPLSYNNYLDMDAAYRTVAEFDGTACAIVKHTNTCGLAQASNQADGFLAALEGDPISAFGSVIGFNQPLEVSTAQTILDKKLFVECIVAPNFTREARELLANRKNLRLFEVSLDHSPHPSFHIQRIGGGALVQEVDASMVPSSEWKCATEKTLNAEELMELEFAMRACKHLKSNAIAITKNRRLLGVGAGQMSRVDATEHAITKAGDKLQGSSLASDAFFPFDDCVRLAAKAGVIAIVQPGGSKRDQEVIDACNELGLAMYLTGRRHFRH